MSVEASEVIRLIHERLDSKYLIRRELSSALTAARENLAQQKQRCFERAWLRAQLIETAENGETRLAGRLERAEAAQYDWGAEDSGKNAVNDEQDGESLVSCIPVVEAALVSKAERFAQFGGRDALDWRVEKERCAQEEEELLLTMQNAAAQQLKLLGTTVTALCEARAAKLKTTELAALLLAAQSHALLCKAQLLELRWKAALYTRPHVVALTRLSGEIRQAKEQQTVTTAQANMRKKTFEELGKPMEAIAAEYAQVLQAIKEIQWNLKEVATAK